MSAKERPIRIEKVLERRMNCPPNDSANERLRGVILLAVGLAIITDQKKQSETSLDLCSSAKIRG
jgi:hypothetical protein